VFYKKYDHELNTKVKNNCPRFPTAIYTPSNVRWFRRYNFQTTTELLKTVFWTDYIIERKLTSRAVRLGLFP
jgi:hypothetical protein